MMKKSSSQLLSSLALYLCVLLLNVSPAWAKPVSPTTTSVLLVQPARFVFGAVEGQACNTIQTLRVVSSDFAQTTTGTWTASSDQDWLVLSSSDGPIPGSTTMSIDMSKLSGTGQFEATVTVQGGGTITGTQTATVTLIVNDARVQLARWKDGAKGALSVSVDDTLPAGFETLKKNWLKGTYYLNGDSVPGFFAGFAEAGMEMGSHMVNHICWSIDETTFRNNIVPSLNSLCAWNPQACADVNTMAWPCGFLTISEQAIASDYFLAVRGYNHNKLEEPTPTDFMDLKSFNSHEHQPFPPNDLKSAVDDAVTLGKWANLVFHYKLNDDGATVYATGKDLWIAPVNSVVKYILQRDRVIISDYQQSGSTIQFGIRRLALEPTSYRSFETAIKAEDTVTFGIDLTGIEGIQSVTLDGAAQVFSIRANADTQAKTLYFNLPVTTAAVPGTVVITTSSAKPALELSATQLNFSIIQDNPIATQQFDVRNTTASTSMSWTASVEASGAAWLDVSPKSGVNNGTLTVTVNAAGLTPGWYNNKITIVAPGVANSPRSVNVGVEVSSSGTVRYNFNYPDRDAFLRDGWDFIARTSDGGTRNTERTLPDGQSVSFDQAAHPGILRIPVDGGDVWQDSNSSGNTAFRDLPSDWTSLRMKMAFAPDSNYQQMGLLAYDDDDNYVNVSRIAFPPVVDPGQVITYYMGNFAQFVQETAGEAEILGSASFPATAYYMRLDRNPATGSITGFYSLDGTTWLNVGSLNRTLSNPRVCLFTASGGGAVPNADFSWVEVVVPQVSRTLTVASAPDNGVSIQVSPSDIYSQADGTTQFSRTFRSGTTVTLTAPLNNPNGWVFQKWKSGAVDYSLDRKATITMDSNHDLTAVYVPPVVVRTLIVNSSNPSSGVLIKADPGDRNGKREGLTPQVTFSYNDGTPVTLTAPERVGINTFVRWEKNGVPFDTKLQTSVTMSGDYTLTAVYATPPPIVRTLTIASINPGSGIRITISPADNTGAGDGDTSFYRVFNDGVEVTVTAPSKAGDNTFLRWEKDGVEYTAEPKTKIKMEADHTLTAVYLTPQVVRTLSIASSNPDSGATIMVTPSDLKGAGNGPSPFSRTYYDGARVSLTAPSTAGGNNFQKWQKDGVDFATTANITVKMDGNHSLTAVYVKGPPLRTLTLASSNPESGVSITIFPPDRNRAGNGKTSFTRNYYEGSLVLVTAPIRVNGNRFQKWQLDGRDYWNKSITLLRISGDQTLTAVYAADQTPRKLTVASGNPASGVSVSVSPIDNNGAADGSTLFTRYYNNGVTVNLTAPSSVSGNPFQRWLLDGNTLSASPSATVTMNADHTLTAVYAAGVAVQTLTVGSSNPSSGVAVSVKTSDPSKASSSPTTGFTQVYAKGTVVTLTAPATAPNGNTFQKWQKNSQDYSTSQVITLTLDGDYSLVALYVTPPPPSRTLAVSSTNPGAGVSMAVLPSDKNGQASGSTPFNRLYANDQYVMLLAPSSVGGSPFQKWQLDGLDAGTATLFIVKMNSNHALTAVYAPTVRTLKVASYNPSSGVAVTVSPADKNGSSGGTTTLTRYYNNGTTVTLMAPSTVNGNKFQKWQMDGSDLTTSSTTSVAMNADHTLTAIYVTPAPSPLPSPWASKDIGTVGAAGSASYASGVYTVAGSGADIWNDKDEFRFAYQSGDSTCTIVARIKTIGNTDPWAKAGLMIRDSLDSNARHASIFFTPGNGVAMQSRSSTGGTSTNKNNTSPDVPYWVKLVRTYNSISGYYSVDGKRWTLLDTRTIAMNKTIFIGLAVTSHKDGTVCTATFDNVTVTP